MVLIFPRRKFIIYKNDVAFHFRKWGIVTNNPFGFDLPKHFAITF